MDYTSEETIINAFHSERLQYIRVDKGDERLKKFVPQIVQDPVIQAMADSTILQPRGKKDFESYLESVADAFLGVSVCLLPDEAKRSQLKDSIGHSDRKDEGPIIIGIMCIGWGGFSPSTSHHRSSSIGISLTKPYQSKGYGREAINWVLDWGFKHAGLHSISIDTASYNPKAVHLYESIGFKLEGRRRETIWQNRKWHDLLEFGMTEQEWEEIRGTRSES